MFSQGYSTRQNTHYVLHQKHSKMTHLQATLCSGTNFFRCYGIDLSQKASLQTAERVIVYRAFLQAVLWGSAGRRSRRLQLTFLIYRMACQLCVLQYFMYSTECSIQPVTSTLPLFYESTEGKFCGLYEGGISSIYTQASQIALQLACRG